jgi:hypothetical protein
MKIFAVNIVLQLAEVSIPLRNGLFGTNIPNLISDMIDDTNVTFSIGFLTIISEFFCTLDRSEYSRLSPVIDALMRISPDADEKLYEYAQYFLLTYI